MAPGQTQQFTARFLANGSTMDPMHCDPDLGLGSCPPVTLAAHDELLPNALGGCAGTTLAVVDFGTLAAGQVGTKTITVQCFVERLGGGLVRCAGSLVEQALSLIPERGAFSNLAEGESARIAAHISSREPRVHHSNLTVTTKARGEE